MVVTVTLNPSLDEWVVLPALRLGELNRASGFLRYPGGKGINVSRVVRELGATTCAVALAGGSDGKILSELLRRYGIPHRFVSVPGATRNNYQLQTDSPEAITQVNCPGPRVSVKSLERIAALLRRLGASASCVVLSGSLPPGLPAEAYRRLLAPLKRCGIPVVLDTSGAALREGMRGGPWLVKPNCQEAEEFLGRPLRRLPDAGEAARQLVRRGPARAGRSEAGGPEAAIISLGADGAVLAARRSVELLWAKPPKVPVDSAVGAGDSLVAGFVVGYQRARSLSEALRLGVACGAACAMTPGTELCHREDVRRLAPLVAIRTLR